MSEPHVVIVGGGPAGLTAARELRQRGTVNVTVIERERDAGGVPRHTDHLGYGLRDLHRVTTGPRYARSLVQLALDAGAAVRTRSTVTALDTVEGVPGRHRVGIATPDGPASLHADAVILATGVRERPRAARLVPGDRPSGVLTTGALQQFTTLHHQRVGKVAVVVGAEHVSFSAVLTLAHAGCRVAAMVTPFARHQTYWPLALVTSRRHRVPIRTGVDIDSIIGHDRVEGVRLTDGSFVACDTVVFTGDWVPEHELARRSGLSMVAGARAPVVDDRWRSERPGVFAIGNLVHPAETADVCALDGRAVADSVVDWLETGTWPAALHAVHTEPPIAWANWCSSGIALRVSRIVTGRLCLSVDGTRVWAGRRRTWLPNRSVVIASRHLSSPAPHGDQRRLSVTLEP
ncbi:MAG: NAD(P)/FAD-dependent oxidoreductase [Ilumatobacteraceae bacterium]